jgi:hypothetical protein
MKIVMIIGLDPNVAKRDIREKVLSEENIREGFPIQLL